MFDEGVLVPVSVGHDAEVGDDAVLGALVAAEVALARAWARAGVAPDAAATAISDALGWSAPGAPCADQDIDLPALALAGVAGGNPVIPLVGMLRARVPESARVWLHRGATTQDILDSALMLIARRACRQLSASLVRAETALVTLAQAERDTVAAARTLTQHAVPTTIGARAANWLQGVRRAAARVAAVSDSLPAQLAGAGGTLASFAEIGGRERVDAVVAAFAEELALVVPDAPWHTSRWPVTELGDALVQAIDAVGKIATDVATLGRTEIGELAEGAGGGSSAMPQKRNPAASVLIRSAALRAPQLGATLHLAAALAADERPDGAWHAEWPTLRELLRLALGAAATAAALVEGLRVDHLAVALNLTLTHGGIVAERLSLVLGPLIGTDAVAAIVAEAAGGAGARPAAGSGVGAETAAAAGTESAAPLARLVRSALAQAGIAPDDPRLPSGGVAALLDPAAYTGLAGRIVDRATSPFRAEEVR